MFPLKNLPSKGLTSVQPHLIHLGAIKQKLLTKCTNKCAWKLHIIKNPSLISQGAAVTLSCVFTPPYLFQECWAVRSYNAYDITSSPTWTEWSLFWQTTISNVFSWMKIIEFRFNFHWNLFPGVELAIFKPALVQVMAWRPTGDKSLLKLMLTQFSDEYMRH